VSTDIWIPRNDRTSTFLLQENTVAKTYRSPSVASLGAAEVMTRGLSGGTLGESKPFPTNKTTHAMLDL